jgi:hypothetical protein
MERVGHPIPASMDRFDFLHSNRSIHLEHTIEPALDAQGKLAAIQIVKQANFFLVTCGARALDLLMTASARQGAIARHEVLACAKIALPQNELDQLAY